MFFASPYILNSKQASEVEIKEEELDQGLYHNLTTPTVVNASAAPMPELMNAKKASKLSAQSLSRRAHQHVSADVLSAARAASPAYQPAVIKRHVDTNVVCIKFGTLSDNAEEMHAGDPVFCSSCRSVLNTDSVLKTQAEVNAKKQVHFHDPAPASADSAAAASNSSASTEDIDPDSLVWDCEFCHHRNFVLMAPEEKPTKNCVDYVIEPAPISAANASASASDSYIIFCIDVSGSMCVTTEVRGRFQLKGQKNELDLSGFEDVYIPRHQQNTTWVSRLQAVQAAIDKQLETLAAEHPNKKVCIISFSREVTILGDGTSEVETVAGDKLFNAQQLRQIGSTYGLNTPISQSKDSLMDKLWNLSEEGPTALGPALLLATSIGAQKPGSSVIVCTDGLANIGVGALDAKSDEERERVVEWYDSIGAEAKERGVTVSVISLQGDECALSDLGRVAEITGGTVDRVDPLKVASNFGAILNNPILATNVHARFILNKALNFCEEEDANGNILLRDIGNATADTELSFQFNIISDADLQKYKTFDNRLPLQIQMNFTKLDGMKCMRVITRAQEFTEERSKAEAQVDLALLSSHAAQQSAALAKKGHVKAARANALAWGRVVQSSTVSALSSAPHAFNQRSMQNTYSKFVDQMDQLDSVLQEKHVAEVSESLSMAAPQEVPAYGVPQVMGGGYPPRAPPAAAPAPRGGAQPFSFGSAMQSMASSISNVFSSRGQASANSPAVAASPAVSYMQRQQMAPKKKMADSDYVMYQQMAKSSSSRFQGSENDSDEEDDS